MRTTLIALLVAVGLTLTGCGGSDSDTTGTTRPHNKADVTFAQQMVPHHEQALKMVDLTEGHDLDPAVQSLVDGIKKSQTGEVATMSGWLRDWGQKVPSGDMGGMAMNGMLTADQLDQLRTTTDDAAFQKLWLLQMTQHHQGAIPMAKTEIADGKDPDAIALAKEIVRTQEKELDTMGGLIGQ